MKNLIKLTSVLILTLGGFIFSSFYLMPEPAKVKQRVPDFIFCNTGAKYLLSPVINFEEPIAPRLEGLGNTHFEITTSKPSAQEFFDQGMKLVYAFNHAEAHRAFLEVNRLDPQSAMAYWGVALALGPNINDPLPDLARQKLAFEAIQKAKSKISNASELEKDLILAMEKRCTNTEVEQQVLNEAYRQAMNEVYQRHPDHDVVGILYGASIMNTMPWNYYDEELNPRDGTEECIKVLEKVINESNHPGAHHYYIHLIEAAEPDKGVATADVLGDMMPAAGHMVHMPSHIYILVGMYEKAAILNRKAILADEEYLAQCQSQGMYPLAYYPHNIHFLWALASIQGNSKEAIDAAEEAYLKSPAYQAGDATMLQDYMALPLQAYVRFGKWNDILSTPKPEESLLHLNMMWHYARGIAFTRRGQYEIASQELTKVKELLSDPMVEELYAAYNNPTSLVGKIAVEALEGEIAAAQGDFDKAIIHLTKAVEHEGNLVYQEPWAWHYPARQSLGAVLLEAGKPKDAESVYRADLEINRENGWSLFGLYQSLQMQGRAKDATAVQKRFQEAWKYADVALTSSRF